MPSHILISAMAMFAMIAVPFALRRMRAQGRMQSSVILASIFLAPAYAWGQSSYSDNFEAATFNPFWTITSQDNGTITLCTGENHTPGGVQSACFSTPGSGGQKSLVLEHQFTPSAQGDFVVWYYDSLQTYYNFLYLGSNNSSGLPSAFVGTQDFDPTCYEAALDTSSGRTGPNGSCGPFPGAATTNVVRTVGWHELEINVAASTFTISIDGNQVLNVLGSFSFDYVALEFFGPEASAATAYFDDFSYT
jgi:hypothetical protein